MEDFRNCINSKKYSDEEKEEMKSDAENLVNKYVNMSKSELQYNLMQEVAKQKAQGTFDKQKIVFMVNSIKHMLSNESYNQIMQALNNL